jgi:hypothetical protein
MEKWIFGILLAGLALIGCVFSTPIFYEPDPFELTATELISNATETVLYQLTTTQYASGFPLVTQRPDPFQLTATELIRTATEGANYRSTLTQQAASVVQTVGTPDRFELTATQLIADATQTAVSLLNAGCTIVKRRAWIIRELITDRISQTVEVSANSFTHNVWVCDGEWMPTRQTGDYLIDIVTFEKTITADVAAELIERTLELLTAYPPDDSMMPPIIIQVLALPNVLEPPSGFVLEAEFTYEAATIAYENGLRGQALLDALEIEVPE